MGNNEPLPPPPPPGAPQGPNNPPSYQPPVDPTQQVPQFPPTQQMPPTQGYPQQPQQPYGGQPGYQQPQQPYGGQPGYAPQGYAPQGTPPPKKKTGLIIGGGVAAAALIVGGILLFTGDDDDKKTVAPTTTLDLGTTVALETTLPATTVPDTMVITAPATTQPPVTAPPATTTPGGDVNLIEVTDDTNLFSVTMPDLFEFDTTQQTIDVFTVPAITGATSLDSYYSDDDTFGISVLIFDASATTADQLLGIFAPAEGACGAPNTELGYPTAIGAATILKMDGCGASLSSSKVIMVIDVQAKNANVVVYAQGPSPADGSLFNVSLFVAESLSAH